MSRAAVLPGPPLGHAALVERLWAAARAGRLPHALLLEGPAGIGKFVAARWFAAGLLCAEGPGPPCGRCGPDKRVASGNHPDLFVVDPVAEREERLRIFRIAYRPDAPGNDDPENCIEIFLDLLAVESAFRPVLLREAHRMNAAAQNALLKTLEEPRAGTVLVLETHRADLLLPTILSRCVRVRMAPLAPGDGRAVLEEHGVEGERAARLARWSEGSPGQALTWAERGAEGIVALLVAVAAGRTDPLAALPALLDLEGRFPGTTPAARARERARTILDLALALTRDLQRVEAGLPCEELAFGDEAGAVGSAGGAWAARLEALLECRLDVERNVGPDGLVERALLVLADAPRILLARAPGQERRT